MSPTIPVGAAAVAFLLGAGAIVSGQAERTTGDGVYTEAQAKKGGATYVELCATCHGEDLKGTDVVPGLTGPEFEVFWKGQPLGDLFERVNTTMPKSAPGSLMPQQSADLVAYLLSTMKAPAGSTELPSKLEELKQIRIK